MGTRINHLRRSIGDAELRGSPSTVKVATAETRVAVRATAGETLDDPDTRVSTVDHERTHLSPQAHDRHSDLVASSDYTLVVGGTVDPCRVTRIGIDRGSGFPPVLLRPGATGHGWRRRRIYLPPVPGDRETITMRERGVHCRAAGRRGRPPEVSHTWMVYDQTDSE